MNSKRLSYALLGLIAILCLALVGAAVMGDSLFKKKSRELSDAKAQNQVIKEQEVSLARAKSDIEKYTALDNIAKTVVPQDKDQAKTILEINKIASESGITLQQITFDTSTLGQAVPKPPASTGEAEDKPAATPSAPKISQVKPVEGISGVYSLEITVSSGGTNPVSYYRFLQFLEKLEANRRTAHVSNITVTPSEKDGNQVTFSLTLNAYLKP